MRSPSLKEAPAKTAPAQMQAMRQVLKSCLGHFENEIRQLDSRCPANENTLIAYTIYANAIRSVI